MGRSKKGKYLFFLVVAFFFCSSSFGGLSCSWTCFPGSSSRLTFCIASGREEAIVASVFISIDYL